jgi:hypothetical protein
MHPIYLFPTCAGVIVAGLILVAGRRRQHGMIGSILVAGVTGAVVWYLALFASVMAIWFAEGGSA